VPRRARLRRPRRVGTGPSCGPFACAARGAPGHAAVPTPDTIHLRVVHHHRLAVHGAFLRLAADTSRGLRVPAGRLVIFDSTSSAASSADSLVEMASCSDSNGASSDGDEDAAVAGMPTGPRPPKTGSTRFCSPPCVATDYERERLERE
jgi:hypothetical protein